MPTEQSDPVVETSVDTLSSLMFVFGHTTMNDHLLSELQRGSVILLDQAASDPIGVHIYVEDQRFAEGEIITIGESFGIRITQILEDE